MFIGKCKWIRLIALASILYGLWDLPEASADNGIAFDHRGLMTFPGNVTTNLIAFGSGWKYAAQDYCLKNIKKSGTGNELRFEGDFEIPGASVKCLETTQPATNEHGQKGLKITYTLSSANVFSLDNLFLAIRLPAEDASGDGVTVDGKVVPFPKVPDKEYLPFPPTGSRIDVVNRRTNFQITGSNLPLACVDSRTRGKGFIELRLSFGSVKNTTSTSLTFDVFAVEKPLLVNADKEWIELPAPAEIVKDGILDFSFRSDAPAGKYGRIIANEDGRFVYENRPETRVRLVGTNLCFGANYLPNEIADKVANHFRLMGYNAVRFHHTDVDLMNGAWNAAKSDDINAAQQDKLDYLFAAMKRNGMYISVDLYTMRRFGAEEIEGWNKRVENPNVIKALIPILPGAFEAWKKMALKWLNHVNPYTGLAMKDDPTLLSICPVNEDSIASVWAATPEVKQIYLDHFERWKTGKEGDPQALFARFLTGLKVASNQQMAAFFKEHTIAALITGSNWWNTMAQTFERSEFDLVDNHQYWDHPQPAYNQNSDIKSSLAYIVPCFMMPTRIFGKPFTVTEYNFCAPNQFRAEAGAMFGAYAALQEWDGVYRFAWSHKAKTVFDGGPIQGFDLATDPLSQLTERQILLLFGRGDVSPAGKKFIYAVTMDEATRGGVGDMWAKGNFPRSFTTMGLVSRIGSQIVGDGRKIVGRYDGVVAECAPPADELGGNPYVEVSALPKIPESGGEIVSDTGEIFLNNKMGYVKVVTRKSECLVAPAAVDLEGKNLTVKNSDAFASISASSMDGKDLEESGRILLFHLTNVLNSGMQFTNEKMTSIVTRGELPHLVRAGSAEVTLKNSRPGMKLYAVDFSGKRMREEKAEYTDGAYRFKVGISAEAGPPAMIHELAEK